MNNQILLEILADDKHTITYRPRLASFTNSALAAILLQQIIYWWKKQDGKPFFKFRAPSSHKKYVPGDSWCEELELNPHEFDGALKIIGTKIVKGISKSDILATEMPIRKDDESDQEFYDRLKIAVSRCVIYWTDSNRITWYFLNAQLLGNFVSRIYLDNCYSLKYLKSAVLASTYKNRKSANTSKDTETNTETNTDKAAAAPAAADPTPVPVVTSTEIDKAIYTPSQENAQAERSAKEPTPVSAPPPPIDEPRAEIFEVYEQGFGLTISGVMKDELLDTAKEFSMDWIRDAIKETAMAGVKNWKYTRKILDRWKIEGRKPSLTVVPKPADSASAKVWKPTADDMKEFYAVNGKASGDDTNGNPK